MFKPSFFCSISVFILFCPLFLFAQTKIPFELTDYNNLKIKAIINQKDTVNLMFHTAANSLTLTEEATKKIKNLVFDRSDNVKSWGGNENSSRFSKSNVLQIGELKWENIPIWENTNSGQQTDGKFGLELFANKVIEIDFDQKMITLYNQLPAKVKEFEKLKLTFEDEMMFVEGDLQIDQQTMHNKFLVHSGYAGTILLDDQFTVDNAIDSRLKVIDEKTLKDSFGNILKTKKAIVPIVKIGKTVLNEIPVSFFTGALGRQKMSIIGGDVLKRFNIIIDAERTNIYLKANKLMNSGYWKG
ncbi:hypothetical protein GM921_05055 [Pedobacter sp. LMG 31464]|uniref:Aspartyl protease n=1 Tax=Pedobacter planticolens TaxID=2679964 RepID=A0A923IUF7_9SPHI|nr:aspartyl protease family protein [Pedobacter planticolens]MBB2144841.1 hypothetical protein [Pedobacter planticolens]